VTGSERVKKSYQSAPRVTQGKNYGALSTSRLRFQGCRCPGERPVAAPAHKRNSDNRIEICVVGHLLPPGAVRAPGLSNKFARGIRRSRHVHEFMAAFVPACDGKVAMARTVLLVCTDPQKLSLYERAVAPIADAVQVATTFPQAKTILLDEHPDVLVTELRLNEFNGIHLALWSRVRLPHLRSVIIGNLGSESRGGRARSWPGVPERERRAGDRGGDRGGLRHRGASAALATEASARRSVRAG